MQDGFLPHSKGHARVSVVIVVVAMVAVVVVFFVVDSKKRCQMNFSSFQAV